VIFAIGKFKVLWLSNFIMKKAPVKSNVSRFSILVFIKGGIALVILLNVSIFIYKRII